MYSKYKLLPFTSSSFNLWRWKFTGKKALPSLQVIFVIPRQCIAGSSGLDTRHMCNFERGGEKANITRLFIWTCARAAAWVFCQKKNVKSLNNWKKAKQRGVEVLRSSWGNEHEKKNFHLLLCNILYCFFKLCQDCQRQIFDVICRLVAHPTKMNAVIS